MVGRPFRVRIPAQAPAAIGAYDFHWGKLPSLVLLPCPPLRRVRINLDSHRDLRGAYRRGRETLPSLVLQVGLSKATLAAFLRAIGKICGRIANRLGAFSFAQRIECPPRRLAGVGGSVPLPSRLKGVECQVSPVNFPLGGKGAGSFTGFFHWVCGTFLSLFVGQECPCLRDRFVQVSARIWVSHSVAIGTAASATRFPFEITVRNECANRPIHRLLADFEMSSHRLA